MSRTLANAAQDALDREPGRALAAIRKLRIEVDQIEEAQVANALSRGWSWARIGRALGVSRQAVHRKFARCQPAPFRWSGPRVANNLKVAIMIARTEAAARGDALVGTEHLLAGLLQQGDGCAADALTEAGVALDELRRVLDAIAPSGIATTKPSQIGFTTRARTAIERAALSAGREGSSRVTEEHLLRVLLHMPGSGAAAALAALDVSRDAVDAALPARTQLDHASN